MTTTTDRPSAVPDRLRGTTGLLYRGLLAGVLAALAYLAVVAVSLVGTAAAVTDPTRLVYPLVWIALSGAAIGAVSTTGRWRSLPAWAVLGAVGYVCLLAWISGQLSLGVTGFDVAVAGDVPGWAPVVTAGVGVATVIVVPFQTLGYLALGLLFAMALSATAESVLAGAVGLFTCAGCVVPLFPVVVAGGAPLLGGGVSYALSTVAFAVALGAFVAIVAREGRRAQCECA